MTTASFFGAVTLTDGSPARPQQCELEYLRSRRFLEPHDDVALAELNDLPTRLESFLRALGRSDRRHTYSTLTILLDTVADDATVGCRYDGHRHDRRVGVLPGAVLPDPGAGGCGRS